MDVKLCKCHGEPMFKHTDARRPAGFYWRCTILKRANARTPAQQAGRRRRQTTEAYRIAKRKRDFIYNQAAYLRKRCWRITQEKKRLTEELDQLRKDNPWLTS